MIFTDLARGTRSVIAILAVAGLLVACSENPDEAAPESTQPDATTPEANSGETFSGEHVAKNVAYVSNQKDGVSVVDLGTMQIVGTIDIEGEDPRGIGVTEDGKLLITANKGWRYFRHRHRHTQSDQAYRSRQESRICPHQGQLGIRFL